MKRREATDTMKQFRHALPEENSSLSRVLATLLYIFFGYNYVLSVCSASAQEPPKTENMVRAEKVVIPCFWDPKRRIEKPSSSGLVVRFLTSQDYPPFNYVSGSGDVVGFNIDLAQALCKELELACTLQARAWEALLPALKESLGDAVISGFSSSQALRQEADLTDIYFKTPARFVVLRESSITDISPESLQGKTIGVIQNTSHAAFLDIYFDTAKLVKVSNLLELQKLAANKKADAIFSDGIQLAQWMNSPLSGGCCKFVGGPYLETRFFGEGQVIVVRKGQNQLRRLLNFGLQRIYEKGIYAELYLKWFPLSVF